MGNQNQAINYGTVRSFHPLIQSKEDYSLRSISFVPQGLIFDPKVSFTDHMLGLKPNVDKVQSTVNCLQYQKSTQVSANCVYESLRPLLSLLKSTLFTVTKTCILSFLGGQWKREPHILLPYHHQLVSVVCSNTAILPSALNNPT